MTGETADDRLLREPPASIHASLAGSFTLFPTVENGPGWPLSLFLWVRIRAIRSDPGPFLLPYSSRIERAESPNADFRRRRREMTKSASARPNGRAMDWRAIGTYRNAVIWVQERPTGCWVAAVVPLPKSALERGALLFPSEEMVLPAECALQTAAVEAAMRYIEADQERRAQPTGAPRIKEGSQEVAPTPEVRRFERIAVSLSATVWASQFQGMGIRGVIRYIAAGGLMVELPVEVVPGSTLRVLFQTPQGPQEVEGRVVWTAFKGSKVRHGLAFPEPRGPEFLEQLFREEDR